MLEKEQIDIYRAKLQLLLGALDAKNEELFTRELDELTRINETALYQEVGKLARALHQALNNLKPDDRLIEVFERNIPDARLRLTQVIDMTNEAANKTMDMIEANLPFTEDLRNKANDLGQRWAAFLRREMDVANFRKLTAEVSEFLQSVDTKANRLKSDLNDVLMAQSFQDLTGQTLKKVIVMMEELEFNFAKIIRPGGHYITDTQPITPRVGVLLAAEVGGVATTASADLGEIAGVVERISDQIEVDVLLSELGC